MTALEDEADTAARGRAEGGGERANEFDEAAPLPPAEDAEGDGAEADGDGEGGAGAAAKAAGGEQGTAEANAAAEAKAIKAQEDEANRRMEAEFAAWQQRIGPDVSALERSLSRVERFALRFRTDIEPFVSFASLQDQRNWEELQRSAAGGGQEIDHEAVEAEKLADEARALAEGELLCARDDVAARSRATARSTARAAPRSRRPRRGARSRATRGAAARAGAGPPFWFNADSGVAQWAAPDVVVARDALAAARAHGYGRLPHAVLVGVLACVPPARDARAAARGAAWAAARAARRSSSACCRSRRACATRSARPRRPRPPCARAAATRRPRRPRRPRPRRATRPRSETTALRA